MKNMMTRIFTYAVLVLCCFAINPLTSSGAVWCSSTVNSVYVSIDGSVIMRAIYRNDYTKICSILDSWKGVDPAVCTLWYSIAKTAVSQKNPIIAFYDLDSCSTIPIYGESPAPGYLMALPTDTP